MNDALWRIGGELHTLAALVDELQDSVGRLLDGRELRHRHELYGLQVLDRLKQYVLELAKYARALSLSVPPEWRVDLDPALAVLVVSELSSRLNPGAAPSPASVEGDCEFFEPAA